MSAKEKRMSPLSKKQRPRPVKTTESQMPPDAPEVFWAAKLAHELNNALMAAQSNLDALRLVLKEAPDAAKKGGLGRASKKNAAHQACAIHELLDDMGFSLAFIGGVVEGMRDFSRPTQKALKRFDVQAAIRDALRQARPEFDKNIRVVHNVVPATCRARGDLSAFQQVLINLFRNAARAMKKAKGQRVLSVRVSGKTGRKVTVAVSDTGPGVRHVDQPRLFQPFFTTHREQGGIGLGLFVSREIMRRFYGDLDLDQKAKTGATFIITLPP